MNVINDRAPSAIRKVPLEHFTGRVVACDASMAIHQYLIATQYTKATSMLAESSHLLGLFNRTIQFLEHGIRPIWVFRPQTITETKRPAAKKYGFASTAQVTPEMEQEAKTMLRLMGLPVIDSLCASEAQCVALVNAGKAYAVASEDMDSLPFGTRYLLRGFNSKKEPIMQIDLLEVLRCLDFTMEEFIDFSIILGCDFCNPIKRVGPSTAYKLIKQFSSIEKVLDYLGRANSKVKVPKNFAFEYAREKFTRPQIADISSFDLTFKDVDEGRLREFLIRTKGFNQGRIDLGLGRVKKSKKNSSQLRLESFIKR